MPMIKFLITYIMPSCAIIEVIFGYRGLGYLFWKATSNDVNLFIASVWIMILLIILACFLLDLVVSLLVCNQKNQYTPIVQDVIRAGQIPSKSNLNTVITETSNTFQLQKGWISRMVLGFLKRPTGVIALGILIVIGIIGLIGPGIAAQNPP